MLKTNELTPAEYAQRYIRPHKGPVLEIVLDNGTSLYGESAQPYGRNELKIGVSGEGWTVIQWVRVSEINAL